MHLELHADMACGTFTMQRAQVRNASRRPLSARIEARTMPVDSLHILLHCHQALLPAYSQPQPATDCLSLCLFNGKPWAVVLALAEWSVLMRVALPCCLHPAAKEHLHAAAWQDLQRQVTGCVHPASECAPRTQAACPRPWRPHPNRSSCARAFACITQANRP